MLDYTPQQLIKIYRNLPPELKEALGSEETLDTLDSIFEKYNLSEEQYSKLSKAVRDVLMGLLKPGEFQETLEVELELEKEKAKKIAFEINRYIFRPVRESLRLLYEEERPEEEKPKRQDIYREPIE